MTFERDNYCFACGMENPNGLQMNIEAEDGHSHTKIEFPNYMQGYSGVVHGGIIAMVLDELAVYAGISLGHIYATGEINIRFKRPVETEDEYIVESKVIEDRGKVITAKSFLKDYKDVVYAQAEVKLIRIND